MSLGLGRARTPSFLHRCCTDGLDWKAQTFDVVRPSHGSTGAAACWRPLRLLTVCLSHGGRHRQKLLAFGPFYHASEVGLQNYPR